LISDFSTLWLAQAHACASTIFLDKLHTCGFQRPANCEIIRRRKRYRFFGSLGAPDCVRADK
jgi:hypothetical protein